MESKKVGDFRLLLWGSRRRIFTGIKLESFRNYEEAKRSYRWMWAWFAIMTIGVISELSELALNGVGLVFFLIWLSTLSRQSHYLMTGQIKFTKKSWIIAVGIWGLLTLAFFVLILILSFVYLTVTESIIASGSLIRVNS